ncbi:hypothetical protein J3Q64DRAFT_1673939 [Phycomyces blakesleeanus]|uniref:Uncharacterized protein n=1 Tax=Phycomyces blakesleeanus TaxID=4837 RepID=A0ABR3B7G1_PHYBL
MYICMYTYIPIPIYIYNRYMYLIFVIFPCFFVGPYFLSLYSLLFLIWTYCIATILQTNGA